MQDILAKLTRYAVSCARAYEADRTDILAEQGKGGSHPGTFNHEDFLYAAHIFLALYVHEHEANPYFGKDGTLARHRELVDLWVGQWEASEKAGKHAAYSEWPAFMTCRALDLLGAKIDAGTRRRWTRFLASVVEHDLPKPFFFTAPNHEAWRLAFTAVSGRVLGRRDWLETAAFQGRQIIRYQTPQGFWEEGRHHGPSMKYNSLMLGAMAVLAEETGSREIRKSAARLARHMVDWCFPDGVTVGAFDGRQSASPGYFGVIVPGLELAPGGLEHVRRVLDLWERLGWLDDPRAIGPSNWYAYFGMPFAAESLLYYAKRKPAKPAKLVLDGARGRLESHTPQFDGVMARSGPWITALSGQLSDVPKETQFVYRLERQSRIELWHERASLVLGGGHSLVTARQPLFNAWVDTGFFREIGGYARSSSAVGSPEMACRRAKYYPRAASSGVTGGTSWLELVFAHATVRFELTPRARDVDIRYSYEAIGLEELKVALPLVLWRGARGFADGRALPAPKPARRKASAGRMNDNGGAMSGEPFSTVNVTRAVTVESPCFDTTLTLTVPKAGKTLVLWPLWPLRTYGELFPKERFESFFSIALVETTLANPGRSGSGAWRLSIR